MLPSMISTPILMMLSVAHATTSPMTLAMANTAPEPGDAVSIEVRWTNVYERPVQIPADWTEHLKMWVFRVPPGEEPSPMQVSSEMEMTIAQARQMTWLTVQPGEVLTHELPIDIEQCQEGCIGGSYYGQVNLSWGMVDGRSDDQLLPQAQVPFNFDVRLPLEALSAERGIVVSLAAVEVPSADGNISATVDIRNGTGAPLWMPNPDSWQFGCTLTDKKGEPITMQTVGAASGALTEEGYQLVALGESVSVPVICASMFEERLPKKSKLSITLTPTSGFFPVSSHEQRAVLTGFVSTGEPITVPAR